MVHLKKELQLCVLVMVSPVAVEKVASCHLTFLGFILAFSKAEPVHSIIFFPSVPLEQKSSNGLYFWVLEDKNSSSGVPTIELRTQYFISSFVVVVILFLGGGGGKL